jgi:hypothetical protein
MELVGVLKVKYDTQKVSEKFQKRDFVVTTDMETPYPQHVIMQITQDKCIMLDQYNVGDMLKVQINLRGREWNGPQGIKYFNTIEAWRVELVPKSNTAGTTAAPVATNSETPAPVFNSSIADNDDLPF